MGIKYRLAEPRKGIASITPISVDRETPFFVFVGEAKERKRTKDHSYHDTEQQAIEFLKSRAGGIQRELDFIA